jgi:hypothetical protein
MRVLNSFGAKGQVLSIDTTNGEHYQFGMQFNPEWRNQNNLEIKFFEGKSKYTSFSVLLRTAVIVVAIYCILEKVFK